MKEYCPNCLSSGCLCGKEWKVIIGRSLGLLRYG